MDAGRERLAFLLETVQLEAEYLRGTDARLFAVPFTPERAATLRDDADPAEQLDAFVARFARLQDMAGDKPIESLFGHQLGVAEDRGFTVTTLGGTRWLRRLSTPQAVELASCRSVGGHR